MRMRQVDHFLAVANYGSLRWAAQSLELTEAALSKSIQTLERDLGVQLFERSPHGMVLTEAGHAFTGPATSMTRTVEDLQLPGRRAVLTIATWGTLSVDPVARLVGDLRTQDPEIHVRIVQAHREADVPELVRDGSCEVGAVFVPAQVWGLETVLVSEDRLWLIQPPGSPEPAEVPVPLEHLVNYRMVVVAGGSQAAILGDAVARAGIRLTRSVVCDHREGLMALVLAGLGASIAASAYAAEAARRGAVVHPMQDVASRNHALIHRRVSPSGPARTFIALARQGSQVPS